MSTSTELLAPIKLDQAAQELLFLEARTANTFTDAPVSEAQLRAIFELAKWPPTSGNTQPMRALVLRSHEARERVVAHLNEPNKAKTLSAPVAVLLAADHEFHQHMDDLLPYLENASERFADPVARERVAPFNAALQAAYFIIAVRAAGLAAGPMSGFDPAGMDSEFFPDGRHRSLLVVNIGEAGPDAWFERLPRLAHDQVVTVL